MHRHIFVCLGLAAAALVAGPASAVEFKLATVVPEGTALVQTLRDSGAELARRTDNRATFKIYPGGVMGTDSAVLRKIRAGQLHGGALTAGALAEVYPDIQLYNLPLLFRDYGEVDAVRKKMDTTLMQGLEDKGFVNFGFMEAGFAYLMSNAPARHTADLRAQKIWIPEGDTIARRMLENVGVSPIPLAITDVLTGLQTGLISTIAAAPIGAVALQWHTQVKYLTDLPLAYIHGAIVIDRRSFQKLSAADQTVLREVLGAAVVTLSRDNRTQNEAARNTLRKQGVEFVPVAHEDALKLQESATKTINQLRQQGVINPKLIAAAEADLAQRRKPPAGR